MSGNPKVIMDKPVIDDSLLTQINQNIANINEEEDYIENMRSEAISEHQNIIKNDDVIEYNFVKQLLEKEKQDTEPVYSIPKNTYEAIKAEQDSIIIKQTEEFISKYYKIENNNDSEKIYLNSELKNYRFKSSQIKKCKKNVLIGLIGPAGSGKTTVADMLKSQHFKELTFAENLKNVAANFGFNKRELYGSQQDKERVNKKLGISSRQFMQKFGTDICRNVLPEVLPEMNISSSIWIKLLEDKLEEFSNVNVVISDCRFYDEAEMIRKHGGYLIKIERPEKITPKELNDKINKINKISNLNGVEQFLKQINEMTKNHASETEQLKIKPDYVIVNDSDISELLDSVISVMSDINSNHEFDSKEFNYKFNSSFNDDFDTIQTYRDNIKIAEKIAVYSFLIFNIYVAVNSYFSELTSNFYTNAGIVDGFLILFCNVLRTFYENLQFLIATFEYKKYDCSQCPGCNYCGYIDYENDECDDDNDPNFSYEIVDDDNDEIQNNQNQNTQNQNTPISNDQNNRTEQDNNNMPMSNNQNQNTPISNSQNQNTGSLSTNLEKYKNYMFKFSNLFILFITVFDIVYFYNYHTYENSGTFIILQHILCVIYYVVVQLYLDNCNVITVHCGVQNNTQQLTTQPIMQQNNTQQPITPQNNIQTANTQQNNKKINDFDYVTSSLNILSGGLLLILISNLIVGYTLDQPGNVVILFLLSVSIVCQITNSATKYYFIRKEKIE